MTSHEIRIEVKKTLAALNVKRTDVSTSVKFAGYSIAVEVRAKNETVDMVAIERALAHIENIDRCESTGEILSGGNTLLMVTDFNGRWV